MAKLGKFITAAGGVLVAVFSLIGMIVVMASGNEYIRVPAGVIVDTIFKFLILLVVSAKLIVGGLLMFDRCRKLLSWMAIATAALVLAAGLPLGFYAMCGALLALAGTAWESIWAATFGQREQQSEPNETA